MTPRLSASPVVDRRGPTSTPASLWTVAAGVDSHGETSELANHAAVHVELQGVPDDD
jgi:hypothetical protein